MIDVASLENVRITLEERVSLLRLYPEDVDLLSPPERLKHERAMLESVFGENVTFRTDPATGRRVPKELGVGSEGRTNTNHEYWSKKRENDREMNEAILAAVRKE
jgi:hypothetical protein